MEGDVHDEYGNLVQISISARDLAELDAHDEEVTQKLRDLFSQGERP